jgi:hypothetical protein
MWVAPSSGGKLEFDKCAIIDRYTFNDLIRWYGEALIEEFDRLFPEEKQYVLKDSWTFRKWFKGVFDDFIDVLFKTLGIEGIFVCEKLYSSKCAVIATAGGLHDYAEAEGIIDELLDELRKRA